MTTEASQEIDPLMAADSTPEVLERVRQEMGDLFRHANHDHPMMRELHRLCVARRIRQLNGESL